LLILFGIGGLNIVGMAFGIETAILDLTQSTSAFDQSAMATPMKHSWFLEHLIFQKMINSIIPFKIKNWQI